MTDPNGTRPDDCGIPIAENGVVGRNDASAKPGSDHAPSVAPVEGGTESLADKAALIDADSILDPVTPANGARSR